MSDEYMQDQGLRGKSRCEFERTLRGEYCAEESVVRLDGLNLCNRHAERLRLEDRATYWRAILAHVELWSGEARRRGRGDVVRLLEVERASVSAALRSSSEELEELQDGRCKEKEASSGDGRAPPLWPPLLLGLLFLSISLSIGAVSG